MKNQEKRETSKNSQILESRMDKVEFRGRIEKNDLKEKNGKKNLEIYEDLSLYFLQKLLSDWC